LDIFKSDVLLQYLHCEMIILGLLVLDDVEKMRKRDLKMKIKAKEFDERFDNGEDIFDLMENPKIMSMEEFNKDFLKKR